MASAMRRVSCVFEESESRKEELEEEDTCVYDQYKDIEDVTDDMFSENHPKEFRTYLKYEIMTEGFYVPFVPKRAIGVATPIDTSNSFWPRVEDGAEFAVEHYNKKRAGPDGQLKLVSLRNVNMRLVGGIIFYITLAAQKVTSGEIADYQAQVYMGFDKTMELQVFRKDPEIAAKLPLMGLVDGHVTTPSAATMWNLIERDKAGLL